MNVVIIIGSVRKNRLGERVARFIHKKAEDSGLSVSTVDPLHSPFPLLITHYRHLEDKLKTDAMDAVAKAFANADGFILVSPEYNYSIPPALSNTIDYFKDEFARKPVATVTYSAGPFGGRSVAVQLPTLITGVGAVPVPVSMPIPSAGEAFDEQGVPTNPQMDGFADKFFGEYEWYLNALRGRA